MYGNHGKRGRSRDSPPGDIHVAAPEETHEASRRLGQESPKHSFYTDASLGASNMHEPGAPLRSGDRRSVSRNAQITGRGVTESLSRRCRLTTPRAASENTMFHRRPINHPSSALRSSTLLLDHLFAWGNETAPLQRGECVTRRLIVRY